MDFQAIYITILYYIKYFTIGLGIGVGIYYAQFLKPIIKWLKGGIENQDGRLENKDLQITFVSFLIFFIVITSSLGVIYSDSIILGAWGTLAGLYGLREIYKNKDGK